MTIGSGALAADTLITLEVFLPADGPPPPVSHNVLTLVHVGPIGLEFGAPITITLPYVEAELGGADPNTLRIASYSGGSWQFLGGTADMLTETVSVSASFGSPAIHPTVSTYALMLPGSVGGIAEAPDVETLRDPERREQSRSMGSWITLALLGLAVAVASGFAVRNTRHRPKR
jgi:hypothetical protein